jgi:tRNA (guanine-N7-)-methyltransferase
VTDRAPPPAHQQPRFYGRRQGRKLRTGQEQRLARLLPRLQIALPAHGGILDPAGLFGFAVDDVWLEIGFGAGEHLAARAATHTQTGFVGCEVFRNGIVSLLAQVEAGGLRNVRIYPEDARRLLAVLPEGSIGRCFVLFPDPWPKLRHAPRRFIGRSNLERLAYVLRDGAELCVATDDPGHVGWVLEQVLRHPAFFWPARCADDWRIHPAEWPRTRYEQKAIASGRRPHYFTFLRQQRGGSA